MKSKEIIKKRVNYTRGIIMSKNSNREVSNDTNCKSAKVENLLNQSRKISKNTNRAGINTRRTYFEKYNKFLEFVADKFNVKNIKNISAKHIYSYVEEMKQRELNNGYIKSSLSAIRFCHDLTDSKNLLPTNKIIQEKTNTDLTRTTRGASRSWNSEETKKAIELCEKYNRQDVKLAIQLSQRLGLRLNETVTLSAEQIRYALRNGELKIKGKGGKVRYVPIHTEQQKEVLKKALENKQRDDYILVKNNQDVKSAKKSIENFIYNHRAEFQDPSRISSKEVYSTLSKDNKHIDNFNGISTSLSFHGNRHTYAKEQYEKKLNDNNSNESKIKREISKNLGHGREEVTDIYLK